MLSGKIEATTEQILELFVLDRKEHVDQKIKPALDEGKIVLMDRSVSYTHLRAHET